MSFPLLLTLLLLLISTSQGSASEHGKEPDLIEKSCAIIVGYEECVAILRSDPRSMKATKIKQLAYIILDLCIANATETLGEIPKLQEMYSKHDQIEEALRWCVTAYESAIKDYFSKAVEQLGKKSYRGIGGIDLGISEIGEWVLGLVWGGLSTPRRRRFDSSVNDVVWDYTGTGPPAQNRGVPAGIWPERPDRSGILPGTKTSPFCPGIPTGTGRSGRNGTRSITMSKIGSLFSTVELEAEYQKQPPKQKLVILIVNGKTGITLLHPQLKKFVVQFPGDPTTTLRGFPIFVFYFIRNPSVNYNHKGSANIAVRKCRVVARSAARS